MPCAVPSLARAWTVLLDFGGVLADDHGAAAGGHHVGGGCVPSRCCPRRRPASAPRRRAWLSADCPAPPVVHALEPVHGYCPVPFAWRSFSAQPGRRDPPPHRQISYPPRPCPSGPWPSRRRSQASLMGRGSRGRRARARLMGTWPATAMVAEWISSSTPGPTGDAGQVVVVLVEDHAGAAGVAVGVQARPGYRDAEVDVDDADAVPGVFGLVGGEADRAGRRRAEEHLRHRPVVRGDGVRAPMGPGRRAARRPGGDRGGGAAGLVLALVGEQGVVVDVAQGVQPAAGQGAEHAPRQGPA